MKNNAKYTAIELLKAAGVPKPEAKFGKVRVRIAGLTGIRGPNHIIRFQPKVKEIEIVVGVDVYNLSLEKAEKNLYISESAKLMLEKKGKVSTEKAKVLQKLKTKK